MRNPVACVACRTAKRQCIHNDCPPCKRCKDRSEPCLFPSPGTSSIHRQSRSRRATSQQIRTPTQGAEQENVPSGVKDLSVRLSTTPSLSGVNPFPLFTDEVKNSYLRCSYKWSFHHIPTLLKRARERTLDDWLLWAILALAIRFSNAAPSPFATPLEASDAFAAHARTIILPTIEQPTISRIQALLMITGHSWGAGEGRRAWIHLGLAISLGRILALFEETDEPKTREEFIEAEEKRRTAWTCFLMDSLLSGGKGRRRTLSADDMRIQLPCDSESFNFGESVKCERINGAFSTDFPALPIGKLSIVAYSMRVADIWGGVARWACSADVEGELPWEPRSGFQLLWGALDRWQRGLPEQLRYSVHSLHAHSASEQGQAYAYMHCIYFMSIMFLHRSYLSSVPDGHSKATPEPESPLDERWCEWRTNSRRELLQVTDQVCEMLEEMRAFGLFFLRGLVPWIGFTAYTSVGIMLYYYHFPNSDDDSAITKSARTHILSGCAFLKDMRGSWPMADTWRETIKQMQIFYCNIKKGEQIVTPNERREMRNAINDYGALQPSPVHDNPDSDGPSVYGTPDKRHWTANDTTKSLQTASVAAVSVQSTLVSSFVEEDQRDAFTMDFNMFDTEFNIDVDLEAAQGFWQGFWANFPGEVEVF